MAVGRFFCFEMLPIVERNHRRSYNLGAIERKNEAPEKNSLEYLFEEISDIGPKVYTLIERRHNKEQI